MCSVGRRHTSVCFSQTHEEGIADLLADVGPLSYKQLPIILYQVTWRWRETAFHHIWFFH